MIKRKKEIKPPYDIGSLSDFMHYMDMGYKFNNVIEHPILEKLTKEGILIKETNPHPYDGVNYKIKL